MTPPLLRHLELDTVDSALREWGGFLLDAGLSPAAVLEAARDFFALPRAHKTQLAIEGSPHFRGWSEMHNERDWREQLHLGRERAPSAGPPDYLRLAGPNLWPASAEWRRVVTSYLEGVASAGDRILEAIELPAPGADGYLLMKLIAYHAQSAGGPPRPGVAAHVDFSWLTLTLQDRPGLEVRTPRGEWLLVEPAPDTLWVHAGEILQFASRGRYPATPHRVVNRSSEHTRISIPVFVNPPLDWQTSVDVKSVLEDLGDEHVHRVLGASTSIHFGEMEWRRKGLGGWCARCAPPRVRER